MSRLLSARGAVVAAVALAGAAGGVTGARYGGAAAWQVFEVLAAVGVATTLLTGALVARRRLLGGLRRQFALAAALALAALLAATALFVDLMFVSHHDAFFTGVIAVYAGILGWLAGAVVATRALRDVETVRDGLQAVGTGARDVAFTTTGSDEIAGLAAAARGMQTQLAGEERARRELVAAVSHDLRTPITSLRLLAEALDDGLVDDAERREYLGRIGVHVRQLSALIDDLFELSRLEARDISWGVEQIDVGGLVSETVDAMRPQARASAVAVRAELQGDVGQAQANPEQLQRVLFNLLQNAVRHTPPDGSVVVRAERSPDAVEIEVADTGAGIPAEQRERIFDAFVRGDDARSGEGAGLGLAIARAIVEAHGGRIWLVDAPVGTRVRFSLPAGA